MGRHYERQVFLNTASVATATNYTVMTVNVEEHNFNSFIISNTATAVVAIKIVAVNGSVSAVAPLSPANMFGNTASQVAVESGEVYRIQGGYFEKIRIKISSTALIAANVVSIGWHAGVNR